MNTHCPHGSELTAMGKEINDVLRGQFGNDAVVSREVAHYADACVTYGKWLGETWSLKMLGYSPGQTQL